MCLSRTKVITPDTSVQEAEARRQREAEEARYREQREAEDARWAQQRADEERRAQAQLDLLMGEAARQREAQEREIARQIAAQQATEAGREAERQAVLRAQEARAREQRAYAEGRINLMTKAEADIESAYAGFNDAFFGDFARVFIDQNNPEIERQASAKGRDATMTSARNGNLRSSATARKFGDITREKGAAQAQLAGQASDRAGAFRDSVDTQKRDALSSIWAAGAVGAGSLPDGSDANTALSGLGAQIGSLTQTARNRAASVRSAF